MKSIASRMICRLLMAAMAMMPFQAAYAGMIGTDRAVSVAAPESDRAAVLRVIDRAEVRSQLQSMGIDPKAAGDRVMALTDQEVSAVAGKLHSVPAGAEISGLTWILLVVIGFTIYFNFK
ncbi:MAG: PA2779 family protein [Betaproteobacteria bacterium]|nr:PA2779 family protein [Betaproteobacteria bacterium]